MTEVVSWLVHKFGVVNITLWAIYFFSTIPERLLLFLLCSVVLGTSFFFSRFFLSFRLQLLFPIFTALVLFAALYIVFPCEEWPFPGNHPVTVVLSLTIMVSIDRWLFWLSSHKEETSESGRPIIGPITTVVIVSGLAVLLLNGRSLQSLAQSLHTDPAVHRFASGDFNSLALDAGRRLLFASGHGSNYLLAFDTNALDQSPRRSQVEIGHAQSFAYNQQDGELYVLNSYTNTLLYLDATTLALKKTISGLNVNVDGSNDSWIIWDRDRDYIIIASEDQNSRSPTVVVNRTVGEVVYRLEQVFTNVLLHPSKPLLYLTFYNKLLAYDTELRKFIRVFDPGKNYFMDRMELTPDQRELLVAAPVNSAVLRFDGETLGLKESISTVFGVRTLAVDPVRNLLLTGSLTSNTVEVIDLETKARVAKYYVGPWLRTIVVDSARGVAYVSSFEGLFKVDYAIPKANWIRRVASRENHRAAPGAH